MCFTGGVAGAPGFKHIGDAATIFPSARLALLAISPIVTDLRARWGVLMRKAG